MNIDMDLLLTITLGVFTGTVLKDAMYRLLKFNHGAKISSMGSYGSAKSTREGVQVMSLMESGDSANSAKIS